MVSDNTKIGTGLLFLVRYTHGSPLSPQRALGLLGLILPQIYFQATLLIPDPVANDVKFQGVSQPFFVFGILATALCLGHHDFTV